MSAAAAVAAARKASEQREEQELTPYSQKDLAENWEFKILRSATNKFRDPLWMHAVLQEEGRAGWTLVEKFDDSRIRLKRPAGAHSSTATLGFDPYRIWVGMSPGRLALWIVVGTIVLVAATIGVIFFLVSYAGLGHR
jgi:hypothetical protein